LRATESANHPLVLVPREAGFAAIVAGSVNVAQGTSELRAYDYVGLLHAERGTSKPFLDRATYEKLLREVQKLLRQRGVPSYSIVAPPPELRQAVAARETESGNKQLRKSQ